MLETYRWLTRRVLENDLRNPRLTELKAAIQTAKEAVDEATDEPESVLRPLINRLDQAIAALMEETAKTVRSQS